MNLQDSTSKYCIGYDLPLNILIAIARTESDFDSFATRFEPHFLWMWDCKENAPFRTLTEEDVHSASAPDDFPAPPRGKFTLFSTADTEWTGQKTSWGPFQMTGSLLREKGFTGGFPLVCYDADIAAKYACSHLSKLRDRFHAKYGWEGVVAAYNAGSPVLGDDGRFKNQNYVNSVSKNGARKYVAAKK